MDATVTSSGDPQTPTCCACDAGCTNDSSGGTGAASGGSSGAPVNTGTGGLSAPGGGGTTGGPAVGGGGIGVGPATGGGGFSGGPMTGGGGITGGPMTGGGGITGGPMTGGGGITGGPMTGGGGITGGPMTGGGGITGGPMTGGGGITGGPATGGGGLSTAFGHSLSFSNSLGGSSDGTNGNGWFIHQLPTMTFQPSGGVGVIGNPANALWFNPAQSDGTHPPSFPFRASLNYGAVPAQGGSGRDANATGSGTAASQFTLTKDDGSALRYNPGGQLQSVADAGGNTGTAEYNPRQQLTHMRLAQADGTPTSVNVYAYVASGPNVDQLESVTLQVGGQDVSRQRFTYYGVNENYGNVNDLKHIFTEQRDQASGQWSLLGTSYHRYYKPNEGGYVSGLRFLVGPEAYARMSDLGIPPDYATDPTIANFADLYVEYDMQRRVSLQRASAGAYTYRFAYTISNHPVGTNSWRTKTVETLPDGNENHIYVNAQGQAILRVFVDVATGNEWCTYWRYDAQGRGLLRAEPSAVEGYDEALPGLATLKAHEGLVHTYEYYDATSVMAPGYFKAEGVQQGGAGEVTKIRSVNYVGLSGAGIGSVWLLDASTLYQSEVDGGSEPATTSHSYQWYEGTLQPSQRTTTWPVVPTSQNGSGLANHRTVVYDRSGRPIWLRDERGFLFHTAYDQITGAVTQQIQDVQTQGRTDVPNGWTTPAGGGLNLTTDYQSDLLGRVTHALGPVHALDLGGQVVEVRRATWTIYQDAVRQVMVGQGYVRFGASVLMNPVGLTRYDHAGRVTGQIRATRGSGVESPGALTNADTFDQSTWCRWQHYAYDAQGRLSARRVYFLIPPTAGDDGTKDVNYNESVYGYDSMGRRTRSVTPGGTITRTVLSAQGWPLSSWVGTNDAGATPTDPGGGQAGQQAGNNLVVVSALEYDQGQAGQGGNLTKSTLYQDATTTRVTTYTYDYRDQRTSVRPPAGATTTYALDNQGRITQTDQHDPGSNMLVASSKGNLDGRGLLYQSIVYAVDPATGTVGNALTGNTWYDPSGRVVRQLAAGSQVATKTVHDGVGRPKLVYTAISPADAGYPYPADVTHDTVIQQVETKYNGASSAVARTTRERDHDATGTGELTTPTGAQPQARVSYAAMYTDALGRPLAAASYGTNAGSAWTPPGIVPAPSSTVLVSRVAHNSQGYLFQQIDVQGTVTQTSLDQAGRLTNQISNVVAGGIQPDQNQEIDYTYNADGQVLTLTARNPVTGDQITSFAYGTDLSSSDVASNGLLAQKIYPANPGTTICTVTCTYDRLGEPKTNVDGDGMAHSYVYDALGRLEHDCVTTLGGGVDGAVRRISRAYEVRGLLQTVTSYDDPSVGSGSVVNVVLLTYNGFGQRAADYQAHGGAVDVASTPSVQYAYADGSANTVRRTGLTYPSGRQLALSYGPSGSIDDGLSRLESIVDASAGTGGTTLASFAYLGLDTRVQIAYPEPGVQLTLLGTPGGDGGDQYRGLDRFGRLIDQRWQQTGTGGADLERVQFGYDRASNKLWRHNPVAAAAGVARDEFYAYDGLYQLKARQQGTLNAGHTGLSGPPTAEEDFAFDPTGNWTRYQAQGGGSPPLDQTRTHDVDNEITAIDGSAALVAYDHAGNMATMPQPKDGTASYTVTWDAWYRPVKVQSGGTTVARYAYDGAMRRTRKTIGAGRTATTSDFFYSDQWKVLEEQVSSRAGGSVEQFVWCGCSADKLVLRDVSTGGGAGTARLYAMDDGKDVTALCDAAGAVQERFGYAAFGAPSFLDAAFGPRAASSYHWQTLFCGYRFDSESGLYQVRYRYLHSQLGRWLSRDLLANAKASQNLNVYAYVRNRTLSAVDPTGLQSVSLGNSGDDYPFDGPLSGWWEPMPPLNEWPRPEDPPILPPITDNPPVVDSPISDPPWHFPGVIPPPMIPDNPPLPGLPPFDECSCAKQGGHWAPLYQQQPYNGDVDACATAQFRLLRDGATSTIAGGAATIGFGGLAGIGVLVGLGTIIPLNICAVVVCQK